MPVRSPLSSVTPALSMATSVPVPIAIPTSAAASAGASFTPSPAMATTRPAVLYRCTTALFWSGRTSASTSSIPRRRATALAVVQLSPVSMTTRMASALRPARASGVEAFTGSAMAMAPATFPSTPAKMAVAPSARSLSACSARADTSMPCSFRKEALPSTIMPTVHGAERALAGGRVEFRHWRGSDSLLLRRGDDGDGERVFAGSLDTGGEPQHFILDKAGSGDERGHGGPALRQRAGLVNNKGVDLLHVLERIGVLDED